MRQITIIESHWLPQIAPHLCIYGKPLEQPRPFYDNKSDEIKCYVEVRFGPNQWELPMQAIKHPVAAERRKYFARFLMAGEIFEDLKIIRPYLKFRPQMITDPTCGNSAIINLILALEKANVESKQDLQLIWMNNPHFLQPEMEMCLHQIKRHMLHKSFPPSK